MSGLGDIEDDDPIEESESGSARGPLLLVAGVLLPAALVIAAVSVVWGVERRRVRIRWWLTWTALTAGAGILAAGSLVEWVTLPLRLHGWIAGHFVGDTTDLTAALPSAVRDVAEPALNSGLFGAVAGQIAVGAPLAFVLTAVYVRVRKYERDRLGQIEGVEYSNLRPVGILDTLRRHRTRAKIRGGGYTEAGTEPGDGTVALGTGKYGAAVLVGMKWLLVATIILGGPRTGKTRLANSISSQQVRVLGGGALIIDFKGGDDIPSYWAQVAREENRSFYHFALNEKSAGRYRQPHPYASPAPAFYDPLVRGNGDSKTAMLLNSVDRDGDAAAYLRTAENVVMLAFDIAELSGFSRGKGGLETLAQVLIPEELSKIASRLTVESVLAAHPHMNGADALKRVTSLQARVQELTLTAGRKGSDQLLRGAIVDSRNLVSTYADSSALGGRLRPGHSHADTIDLVRAVIRGEIVVFSLPTNDYRKLSVLVATMVLLDLQNTTSTLRKNILDVRRIIGDTSVEADTTPWKPFIVQIEELGSTKSPVAADALLGLLNKSSNEGIRAVLSSQGWADFVAVDGTGVWANQVLNSTGNVCSFRLGVADDDDKITAFSGKVDKLRPKLKQTIDTGGRWRIRARAKSLNAGVTDSVRETRVPAGTLQDLRNDSTTDIREFVWITKTPDLLATHTIPEGPNAWFEPLHLATVKEPPNRHNYFADPGEVAAAEEHRTEIEDALEESVRSNPALAHVLSIGAAAVEPVTVAPLYADVGASPADPWSSPREPQLDVDGDSQPLAAAFPDGSDNWETDWDDEEPQKPQLRLVGEPSRFNDSRRGSRPGGDFTYAPSDATDL